MTTQSKIQIETNIANYKKWNGKIYENAIYLEGEKVTDEKRIAAYKAVAKMINEMMEYCENKSDNIIHYIVRNKELIAVSVVSHLGIGNDLTGLGYSIAGIICDELNNGRELTNTPEKMITHIINGLNP